jgi:hypothetical protein
LVSGGVVGGGRGDGEGWSGSGADGGVAGASSEGGGVRDYHLCRTHRHIIDLWLEAFTICYSKEKAVLKFNHELFENFNMWKQANNMTYEINNVKFGCKLSNLNIPGIVRDGKEKRGFDIDLLKAHYKI